MKALYQKIRSLNGKNYGSYRSLLGRVWDYGDFSLEFLHVQGDPFAPPSRILVTAPLKVLGFDLIWSSTFERRLAISDFLLRELNKNILEKYPDKNSVIEIDNPGPEMLVRNALWVDNGDVRICVQVRLPGDGRKIESDKASEILTMNLPDLLSASLYVSQWGMEAIESSFEMLETRRLILEELPPKNMVAFIPDGSVLPRESGDSQKPLKNAVPFYAPEEFAQTLEVNHKKIRGMGIFKGFTVITGGAYHGKSTLLEAIAVSVFPHILGDGREGIVVDENAIRIGVEEGRYIRDADISLMVHNLPGGVSTKKFSTTNASGSTSEATNLMESIEVGAKTFLIDEDASAVNFLIRDNRMRAVIGEKNEPLVPLTDRINDFLKQGLNFILVVGACGDFLELADNVVVMSNYRAECGNDKVKSLITDKVFFLKENSNSSNCEESNTFHNQEFRDISLKGFEKISTDGGIESSKKSPIVTARKFESYIKPLQEKIRPTSVVERQVKVKLNGDNVLQIGHLYSDVSKIYMLLDKSQKLGAGTILLNLCQNAKEVPIIQFVNELCEKLKNVGFRNLPQGYAKYMALPRAIDIAAILFRLR